MDSTSDTPNPSEAMHVEKGSSLWADAFVRLKKNKLAILGGFIVIFILVACFIVAPVLAFCGWSGNEQDLANRFAAVGFVGAPTAAASAHRRWRAGRLWGRICSARIGAVSAVSALIC